jgi:hypothetical protein
LELDESAKRARVRIGSLAMYGVTLEYGTSKIAARPFMRTTLKRHMNKLKALAAKE